MATPRHRPAPLRRLPLLAALALAACASPDAPPEGPPIESTVSDATPTPADVDVAAFRTLGWLEGRWQGTEPDSALFFEGYRFLNDSTLRSYTFDDAAATVPSDSGAIALQGGVVSTGSNGSRWVVTELADGRVHFAPERGATNSFTWERTGPDAWVATLRYPATADRAAREVVYPMRRLPG